MKNLSRRSFLTTSALGAGGVLFSNLFPRRLLAQSAGPGRRFIFAYFEGGWDILLGLDPRDPATTNAAEHQIDPAYGNLQGPYAARGIRNAAGLRFGPAVAPAFLSHAEDVSIINGIGMDTASHEVGRRYFITGRFPRGIAAVGSSTPAEIVAQVGGASPIPHLSAGVESYAESLPPEATALLVNSITDLGVAFTPFIDIDPSVLAAVQAYQDQDPSCAGTQLNRDGLVTDLKRNQQTGRDFVTGGYDQYFNYGEDTPEMATLRDTYGLNGGAAPSDPEVLAFIAGQAVKNDIAQCVSVRIARDLDTHSAWAQDQAPRQERGWNALASLITDLKATASSADPSRSVFDDTTLVVFSEFGRTPLFNNLQGRDHFLGNSCLVAGAGLRRGVTIGRSADVGMMPVETELATGLGIDQPTDAQRESGEVVTLSPKHVLATVLASAGLDYDYLRVQPIGGLLAT